MFIEAVRLGEIPDRARGFVRGASAKNGGAGMWVPILIS